MKLTTSRAEAEEKLKSRIAKGTNLRDAQIPNLEILELARNEYYKWDEYNNELLIRIFSNDSIARDYRGYSFGGDGDVPLHIAVDRFRDDVGYRVRRLESIVERLELIPEIDQVQSSSTSRRSLLDSQKVFVVHGHDDRTREAVARFIERLGLKAIVLHEQPNAGRTIIEKFENYADVGYAVVLLTPDDVGAVRSNTSELNPRARQNVIFELGFFVGRLGRDRVCALYSQGVELPSDIQGVVYVPLDTNDGWHLRLAKELRQAGMTVDLNRVI